MQRVVLINANLIDLDTGARPNAVIEIVGDRIAAVSFGGAPPRGPDARVIDLQGASVMPGLFSCHYHATYHDVNPSILPLGMEAAPALLTLRGAKNIRLALDSGFTSVVSAGASYAIDASLKVAVEEGLIPGPRIMAGSRDLSTTGHSVDLYYPWHWGDGAPPSICRCDGPEEFRRGVREEIRRGAEIIKIFASAGHGVRGLPGKMELTAEELRAAVEAAHQRGAMIRGHIANKLAIMTALAVGVDVIDHGDGLDQECIDRFVETGAFLAPSMFYPYRASQVRTGPAIDKMRADMDAMAKMLSVANKAGVRLVLGDDFGAVPLEHGTYGEELDFYVNVIGIPALDVIRWGTRNGALLVGRGHELGDLKPGALADLIVVDGDPIADIALLKDKSKLAAVMKGGVFHKDALDTLKAPGRAALSVA